ncbi:helix-turn-helix domain-containing protein [Klebsiella indica]|uniref:Winged helix-turn-helix domain-containing protein n=1 Tax=Klebsiella indica TaxID=2582917 RepID=A0A5R9LM63_9ENTR|nr:MULTISPECIES: helix-turn-helix domain-containing protein [Klebsiella]TLV21956.1 winged helix-turn-helix domain-containing protein [Klebsiella indica]
MRFDIEGFITFDTEEASLVNLLTGDCIELSATSTRLLATLLRQQGDIISRIDIFQAVFEKYGARPSNSNLNQYISTLRRSLSDLGIEKNVIITIPRIGFKISDEIIVTTDCDYHSSFTLPDIPPELSRKRLIWRHRKTLFFALILSVSIFFITYSFFYKKQTSNQTFYQDKCSIHSVDALSTTEFLDNPQNEKMLPSEIDCSTPKEIYFFKRKINDDHGLGRYMNIFILECDLKHQQCHSYYYKEIKNA